MKQTDQAITATKIIEEEIGVAINAAVNNDYTAFGAAMERIRTNNRKIQEILTNENQGIIHNG